MISHGSVITVIVHILWYSFIISLPVSQNEVKEHQDKLSSLIDETLFSHHYLHHRFNNKSVIDTFRNLIPISSSKSSYLHMCDRVIQHGHTQDINRFSCCTPVDLRHIYNVQIKDGKVIYFHNSNAKNNIILPKIKSMKYQKAHFFHMEVDERPTSFNINNCKEYFNGTLHVVGRGTIKNVYHSLADNFIPIVTQIFQDYLLDPELLYLPRMQLVGFQPDDSAAVPHIRMIDKLMSAGSIDVNQVSYILMYFCLQNIYNLFLFYEIFD
jgi:hypothetical protein